MEYNWWDDRTYGIEERTSPCYGCEYLVDGNCNGECMEEEGACDE